MNKLTVNFDHLTQSLTITINAPQELFKCLTDCDLKHMGLNNLMTCSELFKKKYERPPTNNMRSNYRSGFFSLVPMTTACVTSPNLGNFSTADLMGRRTIIKKVTIASDYGFPTID